MTFSYPTHATEISALSTAVAAKADSTTVTDLDTTVTAQSAAIATLQSSVTVLENVDERPIWIFSNEAFRDTHIPQIKRTDDLRAISVAEDRMTKWNQVAGSWEEDETIYGIKDEYSYVSADLPDPPAAGSAIAFLVTKGITYVRCDPSTIDDFS